MNPPSDLPLPQFLSTTLQPLLPIFDDTLSPSAPTAQSILSTSLSNLYLIGRMLSALNVFSNNEKIEEVGDGEMVFMTLGWVVGEVEGRMGLGGLEDRKEALQRSEAAYTGFLSLLNSYGIAEQVEPETAPKDPAARRDAKIKAYKREKELKESISTLLPGTPSSSTPLFFIIALLPSPTSPSSYSSTSVNPEPLPSFRHATLLLLQLLHTLTLSALTSIASELDIISNAPPPSHDQSTHPEDPRARRIGHEDSDWRLDVVPGSKKPPRELISGGGKVLRPFTILPSTKALSDKERLRSEVFRSSHRLPTMTIDEYLEEERRRGNIITGGGQASYDAPTESELLELAAEEDGTMAANEAEEKKRLKDENWARFTDDHRRGEGNTMNRG